MRRRNRMATKSNNCEYILTSGSNEPPKHFQQALVRSRLRFRFRISSPSLQLSSEDASVAHEAANTNEAFDSCLASGSDAAAASASDADSARFPFVASSQALGQRRVSTTHTLTATHTHTLKPSL